jgi:hypothetical protein
MLRRAGLSQLAALEPDMARKEEMALAGQQIPGRSR